MSENGNNSEKSNSLPRRFFRQSLKERREILTPLLSELNEKERSMFFGSQEEQKLAESLIEAASGVFALPLGLAGEFLINGTKKVIPLATEEASVVAACRFAGSLISLEGGFQAEGAEALMEAQIFLKDCPEEGKTRLEESEEILKESLKPHWDSLEKRGGGWVSFQVSALEKKGLLKGEITLNVCDAQGANRVNQLAEAALPIMEKISRGKPVMAICSNRSGKRIARATCSIRLPALDRFSSLPGRELAEKIELACIIAEQDSGRAVTHNKGIMNGITALALATGNDTRALEAAVHCYASKDGKYRPLSRFYIEDDRLVGTIELPLPLATRGGITGVHPAAKAALILMGNPRAKELTAIAAAVGLAQNFAALRALTTEGIQKGHMKLHLKKGIPGSVKE